jgi:hypothetical protein
LLSMLPDAALIELSGCRASVGEIYLSPTFDELAFGQYRQRKFGGMVVFIVLAIGVFAGGILPGIRFFRAIRGARSLRGLHGAREATVCINCLLGSALFLIVLFPPSAAALPLLLLLLVGLMVAWILRKWTCGALEMNASSLRNYLATVSRQWVSRGLSICRHLGRLMAPDGWSRDINWSFSAIEGLVAPLTVAKAYAVSIFITPLMLAPLLVVTLGRDRGVAEEVLSAVVGFNAILLASCLTAAVIISSLIAMLLRWMKFIRFEFAYLHVLRRLAGCIGYGTAMGAFTAALVPLVLVAFPGTGGGNGLQSMSPGLLVELPAFGAVAGYLIGLICIVVGLGKNSTNVLYRRTLVPTIFGGIVFALLDIGVSPRGIFERVARQAEAPGAHASVSCEARDVEAISQDSPRLMSALRACGEDPILSGEAFGWITLIVGLVVVLLALITDVWRRHREISAAAPQPILVRDGS